MTTEYPRMSPEVQLVQRLELLIELQQKLLDSCISTGHVIDGIWGRVDRMEKAMVLKRDTRSHKGLVP